MKLILIFFCLVCNAFMTVFYFTIGRSSAIIFITDLLLIYAFQCAIFNAFCTIQWDVVYWNVCVYVFNTKPAVLHLKQSFFFRIYVFWWQPTLFWVCKNFFNANCTIIQWDAVYWNVCVYVFNAIPAVIHLKQIFFFRIYIFQCAWHYF